MLFYIINRPKTLITEDSDQDQKQLHGNKSLFILKF